MLHVISLPVSWPTTPHILIPYMPDKKKTLTLWALHFLYNSSQNPKFEMWVFPNYTNAHFSFQSWMLGLATFSQSPQLSLRIESGCYNGITTPTFPSFYQSLQREHWSSFQNTFFFFFVFFSHQGQTVPRPVTSKFDMLSNQAGVDLTSKAAII